MDIEWTISQSGERKPIELMITGESGDQVDHSPDMGDGETAFIKLTPAEAEKLGSQLVRRARENGAEPWILDNPSSLHGENAFLVLLDDVERTMISNAFATKRSLQKRDSRVRDMLNKIRWMI